MKQLIEDCLNVLPKNRPTTKQLLGRDIFKEFQNGSINNKSKIYQTFDTFTLKELYYWWQLAGGDVFLELKKQGLIRSSPPVLSLPK